MSADPSPDVRLPPAVLAFGQRGPAWADFVVVLPRRIRELLAEWELIPAGEPVNGHASVVLPVADRSGSDAVLKLGFPDDESEHEGLALQRWGGRSTVRLLRADPHRRALLLERVGPEHLSAVEVHQACAVVARLYADLHVPAPPQLRSLTSYVEPALADLAALPRSSPLPRRLVEQAVSLGRDLLVDPASTGTLIHTDLHYENVMASARDDAAEAPWLVIDPKPLSGDPHYEIAPLLWNRWEEVLAAHSVRDAVRRRFHTVVDEAGLDEDRARAWVVVRIMANALGDPERLSSWVSIVKAVQD